MRQPSTSGRTARSVVLGALALMLAVPVPHVVATAGPATSTLGAPAMTAFSAATSPRACRDRAFTPNTSVWAKPYEWRFRVRSTPSGIPWAKAERALQSATWNITGARNPCRMADRVSARARYLGRTRVAPDIGSDSECLRRDGKSVVAFGPLAGDDLGRACYWKRNGRTVEADVVLNSTAYAWYVELPAICLNRWNVEAVATHEFGHVFGLDHVSEVEHGNLTMSELILPCQKAEASLGRGDVLGLRAKY